MKKKYFLKKDKISFSFCDNMENIDVLMCVEKVKDKSSVFSMHRYAL